MAGVTVPLNVCRVGKLSRFGDMNWSTLMPQMRAFLENFSPEQVRENPSACKPYSSVASDLIEVDVCYFLSYAVCNLVHRFTELLCLQRKVCWC